VKKNWAKVFAVCALVAVQAVTAAASSISDLQKQQQQIESQQQQAQSNLNDTRSQKSDALAAVDELDSEMQGVTNQYNNLLDQLDQKNAELAQTTADLEQAQADYSAQYEAMGERMRYMYMNGQVGYLEVLLDATSFSDFLTRVDYIERVAQYDKNMLTNLKTQEDTVAAKQAEQQSEQTQLELLASQQASKQKEVQTMIDEKSALVISLTQDETSYKEQVIQLEDSDAAITKLIQDKQAEAAAAAAAKAKADAEAAAAAAAEKAKTINYNGGQLAYPLVGTLTSPYGWRNSPINGAREFHTGIDLADPMGTPIGAAEAGVVIFAGWQNGYGNVVIVDHGGGLSTLYAHCSKFTCSVGDTVSRGQMIARVGMTGNATGPHVHFEVRVNGEHVNPMNYLG